MALRGLAAQTALKKEHHDKWRKLVRNDKFRRDLGYVCDDYEKWVNGPPLEVTVYEDDDFTDGDLDRKDAFLGTYRLVDHGEDKFLLDWRAFNVKYGIELPSQIIEQVRLGELPRLEPAPAEAWDALGLEANILPSPIIRLSEGLQDIPAERTTLCVGPYQQSLVIEALKGYLTKQTTRSRRDKLDAQLKSQDHLMKKDPSTIRGMGSTTRSRIKSAKKAIGNPKSRVRGFEGAMIEAPLESRQDCRDALAQLPPEEREAIEVTIYLRDMTIDEYAASTQQSVEQVTALIQSGFSKLRALLKDYENTQGDEYLDDDYDQDQNKPYVMAPGCRRTHRHNPQK